MEPKSQKSAKRVNIIDVLSSSPSATEQRRNGLGAATPPCTPTSRTNASYTPSAPSTPSKSHAKLPSASELLAMFQRPPGSLISPLSSQSSHPPASNNGSSSPCSITMATSNLPRANTAVWTPPPSYGHRSRASSDFDLGSLVADTPNSKPASSPTPSSHVLRNSHPSTPRDSASQKSPIVKSQKTLMVKESERLLTEGVRKARENFYIKHRECFLPLLPGSNLIKNNIETQKINGSANHDCAVVEFENMQQPAG